MEITYRITLTTTEEAAAREGGEGIARAIAMAMAAAPSGAPVEVTDCYGDPILTIGNAGGTFTLEEVDGDILHYRRPRAERGELNAATVAAWFTTDPAAHRDY